jgi:hypothetical protein
MRTGTLLLLGFALALVGCGGGGGGNDAAALARLEGRWFGPTTNGSLLLVIDASGTIQRVIENNIDTGQTGELDHDEGDVYEGQLSGGDLVRLILDATSEHAAFFGEVALACLERDATTLPAGGFDVADVAPAVWSGRNYVLDDEVLPADSFAADVTIAAGGSYAGSDASGLTFGSPPGTSLAPSSGVLQGPYDDDEIVNSGFIEVLPSPDGTAIVAVSFQFTNGSILAARFLGFWARQ